MTHKEYMHFLTATDPENIRERYTREKDWLDELDESGNSSFSEEDVEEMYKESIEALKREISFSKNSQQ